MFDQRCGEMIINVTCSAIWGLLDKDDDLRAISSIIRKLGVDLWNSSSQQTCTVYTTCCGGTGPSKDMHSLHNMLRGYWSI